MGQEGQQDHDAVGRHEAPRDDRQGAVARAARSCSSTSRPPASTSSCAATCGRWCAALRESGVTIILTTHYIEEAEEMADRIGVINKGELILVEDKTAADAEARQEAADAAAAAPLDAHPGRRSPALQLALCRPAARAGLHLRRARARTPASRALLRRLGELRHRVQGPADHAELARGHLRQPGEGTQP